MCSPTENDMWAFKEATFVGRADEKEVIRAVGTAVLQISRNFTTIMQPIFVDLELVYGISSFGSDELLLVRDDDDYTFFESSDPNAEPLSAGFWKAMYVDLKTYKTPS